MTQALQRDYSFLPDQREQVILLVGSEEPQHPLILFAHYQENRFSDNFVRLRRIAKDETPTKCVLKHFYPEELTENSYIVICNGERNTTEQLARDFFRKLQVPLPACTDYAKRRSTASSRDGYCIVQFISYALRTPLWTPFYDHTIPVQSVYAQYCAFMKNDKPADLRQFSKILHILLPNVISTRVSGLAHQSFPPKRSCAEQWSITKCVIRENPQSKEKPLLQRASDGLTDCERLISEYITKALATHLWNDFYSRGVPNKIFYENFAKWLTQAHPFDKPILQRSFINRFHILLPTICTIPNRKRPAQAFGTKESIKKTWEIMQTKKQIAYANSIATQKPKFAPHLALTPEGKRVAQYIEYCIKSGHWFAFYSGRISTVQLHQHYCVTTAKMQSAGHFIDEPTNQRMFTKTLHSLFPSITAKQGRQYFPSQEEVIAQWEKAQAAIAQLDPSPDTVDRFVAANAGSLRGTTSVSKLYERYEEWCRENGHVRCKEQDNFISKLCADISCRVEGNTVRFYDEM